MSNLARSSFNFNKESIQKMDDRHPNSNPHTVVPTANNNANYNKSNINTIKNANLLNNDPPPKALANAPKLNPNAAAFSPYPSLSTPGSVPTNDFSSQLMEIEKMLAQSIMKLQEFSAQLNTLQLVNQKENTTQSLHQYSNVYAQYQLEFTNCFLLNQSLQTLTNIQSQQQCNLNNGDTPNGSSPSLIANDKGNRSSPLETIQEEGEEVSDIEDDDDEHSDLIADQAVYDEEYNDDYLDDSKSEEGLDNEDRPMGDTRDIDINEDNDESETDVSSVQIDSDSTSIKSDHSSGRETDTFGGEYIRDALTGEQLENNAAFQYSIKQMWSVQDQYKAEGITDSGLTEGLDKKKLTEILKEMQYGREYILKKKIRGILNKITPENFDKLSQEIVAIINSMDNEYQTRKEENGNDDDSKMEIEEFQKTQFRAVINLILACILDKSVNEPLFSNQYARLCNSLFLYLFNDVSKKQAFRKELLSLCHGLFVKYRNDGSNYKFIGVITMIGDLFTYGLISWNVIISGIFEALLPPKSAVDIFALCELLKTAGNELDKYDSDSNQTINTYIARMRRFSEKFDKRIQFKVDEIYEMRKNQWKQRKELKPDSPKTLKQIHKDFFDSKKKHKKDFESSMNPQPKQTRYNNNNNEYNNHNGNVNYNNNNNNGRYRRRNGGGNTSGRRHQYQYYNDYNQENNGNVYNKSRYHSKYHNNNNNGNNNGRYNAGNRRRSNNGKYQSRPTAEFVKDVTLPDRTPYPANKVLTKTWKMRNAGDMRWGDDVELVYFKGHESLSLQKRYPVMNVDRGEEVEISATIKTPKTPGRYCTYFRLQQYGKFFGPRVWVDIIVADMNNNGNSNRQCSRVEQRNGKGMFGKEQPQLGSLVRCSS